MGWLLNKTNVLDFYRFAIDSFKEKHLTTKLVLHDAFYSMESWSNFQGGFVLDHHLYECFIGWQIKYNFTKHLENVKKQGRRLNNTLAILALLGNLLEPLIIVQDFWMASTEALDGSGRIYLTTKGAVMEKLTLQMSPIRTSYSYFWNSSFMNLKRMA